MTAEDTEGRTEFLASGEESIRCGGARSLSVDIDEPVNSVQGLANRSFLAR